MANHKPPTNGLDKRKHQINRKGRPKNLPELRELTQAIGHERALRDGAPITNPDTGQPLTVIEVILRRWAQSKDQKANQAFVAYGWGKVPDESSNRNINFDVSQFSVTELEQIAAGADPLTVVANRLAATPPAVSTEPDITPDPDALDNE
jgi:hypothetical protein